MRSSPLTLVIAVLATPAFASDGVLEINQTCAVQTGCVPGDTAGLPVTIAASGSYRLTSNLIVPDENTSGIVVAANDVGIDLNNFAIIRSGCEGATFNCAPASGSGRGVGRGTGNSRGTSLKNGSITGMGEYGVVLADEGRVEGVTARWNRRVGISVGSASIVAQSTAFQNGDGINGDLGSNILNNTSIANVGYGISGNQALTISGNTIASNGNHGIWVGDASTIVGNTSQSNGGDGIHTTSGSTIAGNTVRGNTGDGIEADSGSAVYQNTARGNIGFGLNLISPDTIYRENVVTANIGGTVSGGIARVGQNYCDGVNTPSCP